MVELEQSRVDFEQKISSIGKTEGLFTLDSKRLGHFKQTEHGKE